MQKKLILGPPGTGKTTALIEVVADLLSKGVPPEKIAYVSFTRKAAEEARDRAREKFPKLPLSSFDNFRTLHSLAYRELGLRQSDVMTSHNWEDISEMTGRQLSPDAFNDGIDGDNIISFHLHMARAMCRTYAEHFQIVSSSLSSRKFNFGAMRRGGSLADFVKLGEFIDDYKANASLLDFSDMLIHGSNCEPIDVDYAIIDEAQDLSRLQWRFCKSIFSKCERVWIAGDDDQAIYSWAGADLYTFRHMDAEREVLEHSWRLPQKIWEVACGIVNNIEDRYEKDWGPREDEGEVRWVSDLSECPLDNNETWYLLTRTKSLQQGLVHWLRGHGYTYLRDGRHSVRSEHLYLARAWTRLLRGEYVTAAQARALYESMRDDQVTRQGRKIIQQLEPDHRLRMQELVSDYGLLVDRGVWNDVLTIDRVDSQYYKAVKERSGVQALIEEPKIKINTIHGVKGGEADNVYFSNSMGQRPHRNFKAGYTRDDEARIFYVAATRAKKRLFIKPSLQCAFPMPTF